MSKAVLISIRPKWCELIASGKKTIEVRKTRPKIDTPFRCYIYETRGYERVGNENLNCIIGGNGCGKVIGEFICDSISPLSFYASDASFFDTEPPLPVPGTCLTDTEIAEYLGNGKTGYGWHISDLMIYDDPKALHEFMKPCNLDPDGTPLCLQCKRLVENYGCGGTILRPPQSWCYVEELT